jgi:hypothetical protein
MQSAKLILPPQSRDQVDCLGSQETNGSGQAAVNVAETCPIIFVPRELGSLGSSVGENKLYHRLTGMLSLA